MDIAAEAGDAEIHVLFGEDVAEIMAPVSVYKLLFGNRLVAVVLKGFVECMPPGFNTINENAVKVKE